MKNIHEQHEHECGTMSSVMFSVLSKGLPILTVHVQCSGDISLCQLKPHLRIATYVNFYPITQFHWRMQFPRNFSTIGRVQICEPKYGVFICNQPTFAVRIFIFV